METKIDIVVQSDGKISSWWSSEFEKLISEIATEPIENRKESPQPVEDYPFHPEFCG